VLDEGDDALGAMTKTERETGNLHRSEVGSIGQQGDRDADSLADGGASVRIANQRRARGYKRTKQGAIRITSRDVHGRKSEVRGLKRHQSA
jgi:ketol-acid reductoisomerase